MDNLTLNFCGLAIDNISYSMRYVKYNDEYKPFFGVLWEEAKKLNAEEKKAKGPYDLFDENNMFLASAVLVKSKEDENRIDVMILNVANR